MYTQPTTREQKRQLTRTIIALSILNLIILAVICVISEKALRAGKPKLISDTVKNGLHTVTFSYLDTARAEGLNEEGYNRLKAVLK